MLATILTVTTGMAVVQPAFADYDPVGSALIGGVAGAVIGHAVGGRNGAAVGAAIGGVSGALVATQPRPYYERTVYERPVQTAYYAAPAPVTYYRTAYYPVRQVTYYGGGYGDGDRGYYHDRGWHRDWHDGDWRGRDWHDRDWHDHDDEHDRGYYSY
ncbi:MAG: glycine zipper 2TM domain-containing protein [Gammaproteobacteria bacterium]|nr:glycine zipper 2TM domain-containing protein [Gammaproteobacteria bacterium]